MDRKELKIKTGGEIITVSDLDVHNEVSVEIETSIMDSYCFWLEKEELISLRNHINYLLKKIES